jgi:hypothetical protein
MKNLLLPAVSTLLVLTSLAGLAVAWSCAAPSRASDPSHGRYLVEKIGMCWDCHSPRDEKGQIIPERWLQGAVIPFTPTVQMPWAPVSKHIAGLPTLTDEQAMTFLTTGELPGGRRPLPPMPEYRFSPEDARDVIAYLRDPIAPTPAAH